MKIALLTKSFTLLILLEAALGAGWQSPQSADSSSARAKELWELALAAKGGREALYKVTNIAEIRGTNGKNVSFVVLPDRYFFWFDTRPSQFGLDIKLYNFESGFGYRTLFHDEKRVYQDIRIDSDFKWVKGKYTDLLWLQFYLLLETRWLHPKPLSAVKAKVNGKSVDRVDVLIEGYGDPKRFAVFLDEKTHLHLRIAMCRNVNTDEIIEGCCFSNQRGYTDIAGIKIPLESTGQRDSEWDRKQIEINAEYDPQFFDRVPDKNGNGLQWRKAGAKTAPPPVVVQPGPLTTGQISEYVRELGSSDHDVWLSVRRELVTAGRQVLPALAEALKSGSHLLRFRAAVAILEIDKENSVAMAALPGFLLDSQLGKSERQDAAFGLLRNEQGIAVLINLLPNPDPFVRRCVIFAFDELTERQEIPRQVEKALPSLRKLTRDEDEVVRKMAKEVLGQIGNKFKR